MTEQGIMKESEIGLGVMSLNSIIECGRYYKGMVEGQRCFVNYEKRAAGWVNLDL